MVRDISNEIYLFLVCDAPADVIILVLFHFLPDSLGLARGKTRLELIVCSLVFPPISSSLTHPSFLCAFAQHFPFAIKHKSQPACIAFDPQQHCIVFIFIFLYLHLYLYLYLYLHFYLDLYLDLRVSHFP